MFRNQFGEALVCWERKNQTPITTSVLIEVLMEEAYFKNAKPCPVITDFFHIVKTIKKYQNTLQDFGE